MEEGQFALMLRHALTEYDFEHIGIAPDRVVVRLQREVFAENGKDVSLEFTFTNPVLIRVLEDLKSYLPSL